MIHTALSRFNEDMLFTVSEKLTQRTISELKKELDIVEQSLNDWKKKLDSRAFGKIKDNNITYEKWRDIYTSHGWMEISAHNCCYDPQGIIFENGLGKLKSNKENDNVDEQYFASYELDISYLDIWKAWSRYHQKWRLRIDKLAIETFNMSRVTQTNFTRLEDALLVTLGLSPSVVGTQGFENFSLEEKLFKTNKVNYKNYNGFAFEISSNLYRNDGYGHIEWYLKSRKEYTLIERIGTRGQPSQFNDRLSSQKFLKWAYENKYIEQIIKAVSPDVNNTRIN